MFFINPFIYGGAGGDFESIATVTVGSGGASSIEFTSISGSYQHLQVRGIGRCNYSDNNTVKTLDIRMEINGDTGTNYVAYHGLYANGSSVNAYALASQAFTVPLAYAVPTTFAGASMFGAGILDIVDSASTSKYKTIRGFSGSDQNGAGALAIQSALWMSTSAVTSLKLYPSTGASFVQHSTFALYGIKAP